MTKKTKKSMRNQWKRVERRHAELHGATHTKTAFPAMIKLGNTHGRNYPDSFDEFSAIESKSGYDWLPKWLIDAVEEAMINEKAFSMDGDGKQRIPYVVLHNNGGKYDNDLVVIRDDVFREFILPAVFALGKVLSMSWDPDRLK